MTPNGRTRSKASEIAEEFPTACDVIYEVSSQAMVMKIEAHLYDTIEADPIGRKCLPLCSFDIDSIESRFGVDRTGLCFEESEVDRLDQFSPRFIPVYGDNPVV